MHTNTLITGIKSGEEKKTHMNGAWNRKTVEAFAKRNGWEQVRATTHTRRGEDSREPVRMEKIYP